MKQLFTLLIAFLLPFFSYADDSGTCGDGLTYTYDESTQTLTISGNGAMSNYSYNGAPWKSYKANIKTITIVEGVTTIGNSAFEGCSGLTSITIPESVNRIGISAFSGCTGLTSITIPECITSIESGTFYNCRSLTSVAIPSSVTDIGASAFYGCTRLTSITIPSSVTSIGKSAFEGCSGLTALTIPESVTNIGEHVFNGCSGLTSITIPENVTDIGAGAFYGCLRLHTIYCLNPEPPTCNGYTFKLMENQVGVRDQYDIYTYANLHVPMGSEEVYSAAHDWRYFNKIKEDMEMDGKVYYVRLTVQQGTTGYTRQVVKATEKCTIFIGSLGNYKVNAVMFNGVDVTDDVIDGYYTTPELKRESVLSVTYEEAVTGIQSTESCPVKVTGHDGEINISNIVETSDVSVYSADGKIVESVPAAYGSIRLQVPAKQLYIVKLGNRGYKLAL